ncbi:MAG: GldG family protein [Anaerolineae bacterium]|nr:GldG family protein [Anaerolineae bacterium]
MAKQIPDPIKTQAEGQEPIIPPGLLLGLAAVAFLVAIFVVLTQPEPGVVGLGAFAFGVLAVVLWAILAPEQARGALTGRTLRFGGASVFVTVLLIAALVGAYIVARNASVRLDLTESSDFSLTAESRQAIAALGADPSLPAVEITAFYSVAQAGRRDQDEPLLQDYQETSGGKISYEFVDPDLQPGLVQRYSVTANGQLVVAAIDAATGEPDLENAVNISFLNQEELTNAVLKVSAQGEFRATFITVAGSAIAEMSQLKTSLAEQYDWDVQDVSLLALTSPESEIALNDPNVDGEVMILPGGSQPLSDQELEVIRGYLNGGGNLVIFAGTNLNEDKVSLATAENLNAYLAENFGISFNNDVILDLTQAAQDALAPIATDFNASSYITTNGIAAGQSLAVFELAPSIAVAETAPANVTVTELVKTGSSSYAKTDLDLILSGSGARAETDAAGPFVVMASAENSQTGARVILVSSTAIPSDNYVLFGNLANQYLAFNSLVWSTDFLDYFQGITILQQQRPQDQPIFASEGQMAQARTIVLGLPFVVLMIGVYVWWSGRERAR